MTEKLERALVGIAISRTDQMIREANASKVYFMSRGLHIDAAACSIREKALIDTRAMLKKIKDEEPVPNWQKKKPPPSPEN